jgi:adenylate cyclase class 2
MKDQELEIKYHVSGLERIEARLQALGAHLVQPRTHEINLRFDTPDGDFGRSMRVLRLRQDTEARLTYKGPSQMLEGARLRQEIEFTVGDFDAARAFIEALGYQVRMTYEKYRTTYELDGVLVELDELPYGYFVELEGPDPSSIQKVNQRLGFQLDASIPASYTDLFERLRVILALPFQDLTFDNFREIEHPASVLDLVEADQ